MPRVLDLGTGTGVLPRNLYAYGATFTGIDASQNQIAQAVRLAGSACFQNSNNLTPNTGDCWKR